jgi:hypothetical protein
MQADVGAAQQRLRLEEGARIQETVRKPRHHAHDPRSGRTGNPPSSWSEPLNDALIRVCYAPLATATAVTESGKPRWSTEGVERTGGTKVRRLCLSEVLRQ